MARNYNQQVFFELSPSPGFILSKDYAIVDVNPSALSLYAFEKEQVVGKNFFEQFEEPELQVHFEQAVESSVSFVLACDISGNYSLTRWQVGFFEEGERGFFCLAGEDITALRATEEKLYQLSDIIRQLPGNVYWYGKDFIYLGCNENSAKTLSMTCGEVVGQDFRKLMKRIKNVTPETIESFVKDGETVIKTGKPLLNIEEPPFVGPNGETNYWLANKLPLHNLKGEVCGVIGTSTDITHIRRLEENLVNSKAREERLKVLSSMGGMIAHEMRTPLTAISLSVESINQYLPVLLDVYKQWSEEKKSRLIPPFHLKGLIKTCDSITHSLKQADETVNMILNGFKPNQLTEENLGQVAVDALFEALLSEYPLTEKQRALIDFQKNSSIEVFCDKRTVVYVLTNLLKNALYYINEAGKGTIRFWAEETKDTVCLHVRDTARGISADQLDKIFEPFYTSKYAGTSIGMGLYFCKMALESMNVEILCDSVLGEFTDFTLIFPKKT